MDIRGETAGDGGQEDGEAGAADDEADDESDSCMSQVGLAGGAGRAEVRVTAATSSVEDAAATT